MTKVIVYGSRISPFVEKVVRALQVKGIDYALVPPKSPRDLRRWNPQTGKMPVVEIEGERVYDSTWILRHLDRVVPEPPLLSDDAGTAARQGFLEDWADEALYWYVMALRWSGRNRSASARQIVADLPVPAPLCPLVRAVITRQLGGAARAQGIGRLPEDLVVRELGLRLDELVELLGERPFFFAERVSACDLAVYGMLGLAASGPTPEAAKLLAERPALLEWMKRVEQASGG